MKKIFIISTALLIFLQSALISSNLDFRFSRNQNPKIENFSNAAEKFYLDQLNSSWKDASRLVYGYTEDPLNQKYYPWVEISKKYGAKKIDLLRILPFKSSDESIEGYLAFVRYIQENDAAMHNRERFFVDAWFVVDGCWVVSPSALFLMDGTFVPVTKTSAYGSFISGDALDQKIRITKAEHVESFLNDANISSEEQTRLGISRNNVK